MSKGAGTIVYYIHLGRLSIKKHKLKVLHFVDYSTYQLFQCGCNYGRNLVLYGSTS